jgi:hypothetical protein
MLACCACAVCAVVLNAASEYGWITFWLLWPVLEHLNASLAGSRDGWHFVNAFDSMARAVVVTLLTQQFGTMLHSNHMFCTALLDCRIRRC